MLTLCAFPTAIATIAATAQEPDIIVIDAWQYPLTTNPLEAGKSLPSGHFLPEEVPAAYANLTGHRQSVSFCVMRRKTSPPNDELREFACAEGLEQAK